MAKIEYSQDFEQLWKIFPKRCGGNPKRRAYNAFKARLREGVLYSDLQAGILRYYNYCKETAKIGSEFVLQAATFFGQDERWADTYELPKPKIQDQFKGMSRDQQITKKAEILHMTANKGELMHEWTARINSEWLARYPAN